jgi:hypothetical protein
MTLLQFVQLLAAAVGAAKDVQDMEETKRLQGVAANLAESGHDPNAPIPIEHEIAAQQLNARLGNVWKSSADQQWNENPGEG